MKAKHLLAKNCPCKRAGCQRHGNCAACRAYHHKTRKSKTTCERLLEKKKEPKMKTKADFSETEET